MFGDEDLANSQRLNLGIYRDKNYRMLIRYRDEMVVDTAFSCCGYTMCIEKF